MKTLSQMNPRKHRQITSARSRTSPTKLLVDLAQMRRDRGISMRQVEEVIGVSNASLCQIENGCNPSLEAALAIAAFVEMPVEKIWALKGKA
jgi:DNA-binding XRE family transcriptional regulator